MVIAPALNAADLEGLRQKTIAALIAAHGRLMGAAPRAQLLAVRAFDPTDAGAEGTTFNIMKGIDWAATHGARVINMSFAGPADPAKRSAASRSRRKSENSSPG